MSKDRGTTSSGDDVGTYDGALAFGEWAFATLAPIGEATRAEVARLDQATRTGRMPDGDVAVEWTGGEWVGVDELDTATLQGAVIARRRIAVRVKPT